MSTPDPSAPPSLAEREELWRIIRDAAMYAREHPEENSGDIATSGCNLYAAALREPASPQQEGEPPSPKHRYSFVGVEGLHTQDCRKMLHYANEGNPANVECSCAPASPQASPEMRERIAGLGEISDELVVWLTERIAAPSLAVYRWHLELLRGHVQRLQSELEAAALLRTLPPASSRPESSNPSTRGRP